MGKECFELFGVLMERKNTDKLYTCSCLKGIQYSKIGY